MLSLWHIKAIILHDLNLPNLHKYVICNDKWSSMLLNIYLSPPGSEKLNIKYPKYFWSLQNIIPAE